MGFKKFLIVLLILSLSLTLALPAGAAESDELIRQILIYYSHHQQKAETDILQLLEQLRQVDPEAAADWQQILEIWRWAAEDLEVNWDVLPDGLPQDDSLCILVMGFRLNYGGTMGEELIHRLEVALASAEKYPNAFIVCTGGGTSSSNPYATEAGQMAHWLQEHGIDPERIIVENRSLSTEENALNSYDILSRNYPQVKSLALISSHYHLRRCHLLFSAGILLKDLPYTIVGDACFDAGYEGTHEGYFEEAKSLGKMLKLYVENTPCPELTQLTGITVQGVAAYQAEEALSITVTAEYDSGFTRDVTELAEISGFDPALSGPQEVQIRYTENDIMQETTFSVQVAPAPTTLPETQPETTAVPATEIQEAVPVDNAGFRPGVLVIPLGCAFGALALFLILSRPRRGKYEVRRKA